MKQLCLIFFVAVGCAGQVHQTLASQAEKRVDALSSKFNQINSSTPEELKLVEACHVDCSAPEVQDGLSRINGVRKAAIDAVVAQIQAEVDHYVKTSVSVDNLDSDHQWIENRVKRILTSVANMQPIVFESNMRGEKTLILTYSIDEGKAIVDATTFTIRAYQVKRNRLELVDATGDDMHGYQSLSIKKIHSPTEGTTWLLVSGYTRGHQWAERSDASVCVQLRQVYGKVDAR